MSGTRGSIAVPGRGDVTTLLSDAAGDRWVFVYAPGAGSNIEDPFGQFVAQELPAAGIAVMRFQFPYQERKQREGRGGGPDPNPVLEATWRAALQKAREAMPLVRIAAGGRSMGGRIASQVVAAGERVDALGLFAYPLHPPGKPDQRRDAHLGLIAVPTLFCSGTRDAFATPEELGRVAAVVDGARVHLLNGADHGFAVPKSSGRTRAAVWREACEALLGLLT